MRHESIELERIIGITKRLSAEGIVAKLRQFGELQAQGETAAAVCKEAGTTERS
jgi:hypothetical protein